MPDPTQPQHDPVRDVAADLHEQIQRAATVPQGAGAFPGGNLLLQTVLARLKGAATEEVAALVEYLQGRFARYAGQSMAPTGHPTSE